ncbi:tetratricopeptide repeat protein [Aliikangiella sp. IMCC44359]|uniref:tetratricopeptide repeat protein n=1 Tax=Aliikangiella sp. IMCC44359 TaxID=3459125 RepID=UPI00403A9242
MSTKLFIRLMLALNLKTCISIAVVFMLLAGARVEAATILSEAELSEQNPTTSPSKQKEIKGRTSSVKKEDIKKPVIIEDLAYGNILFDYYRGEPIKALNGILVAEKKNGLPNHSQSARLLSGVIYLDLGMLTYAQRIFNELLTEEDLKTGLFSKIEFYLGKLHYRQGDFKQAEFRLSRIVDLLDIELKDECLIMLSNLALYLGDKEKARSWLGKISQDSQLASMSRFNLGILWLREKNLEQALLQLTNIHPSYTEDKVVKSLQDKANVALGYYHLSHKSFEKARLYLQQVRLTSPSSNKALLGMGWSYGEQGNFKKALAHWTELSKRDIRDIAVQEVLLAIPYAYQKLNSMQLSLDNYAAASDVFQQQIVLIDSLLLKIQQEDLIESFVSKIVSNAPSLINDDGIQDSALFGDKYDYYLYELVSQHQFNEGFRSYQKLGKLSQILSYWESQLPAFSDILKANELRFEEKIPLVDRYLMEGSFVQYEQKLAELDEDIKQLKNNQKLHLLANSKQLKIHNRVQSMFDKLAIIPDELLTNDQRIKANRAKGVLQWQLEEGKTAKIWRLEKAANQIKVIIEEMRTRKVSLANARANAEIRFNGYQDKVDAATAQLLGLRDKIKVQIELQAEELKSQIIAVLNKRKATLDYYLLQSDLSVARLHEQAVKIPELD